MSVAVKAARAISRAWSNKLMRVVWRPVARFQVWGRQNAFLGERNFCSYMFKTIFFWAQIWGGTAPECSPVAAGLAVWKKNSIRASIIRRLQTRCRWPPFVSLRVLLRQSLFCCLFFFKQVRAKNESHAENAEGKENTKPVLSKLHHSDVHYAVCSIV